MRELSIFADESRDVGNCPEHYLVTFILHDQSMDIAQSVRTHQNALNSAGLPETLYWVYGISEMLCP